MNRVELWGFLRSLTFLPLVEDGRAWVVLALFRQVREALAAALMDAFLRHCDANVEFSSSSASVNGRNLGV